MTPGVILALGLTNILILVALGVVIAYLIYHLSTRGSKERGSAPPPPDLSNLTIVDARHGDSVSVLGRGDDYDDLDFQVDRRNRYVSGGEEWFEVSGRYRGRRVFVEWYDDDELEVSAVLHPASLKIADLGLSEEDLVRMDDQQDRTEGFEHDGARFDFDGSQEIGYFRDGRGEGEGYYNWDFKEVGGDRLISIEKWEGEPFEVVISRSISPGDIRVFRA